MIYVITGVMASGKSIVAELLASKLPKAAPFFGAAPAGASTVGRSLPGCKDDPIGLNTDTD